MDRSCLSKNIFIVIGSLVVAIIGIWVVLPILRKITDIEQNQTE